MKTTMRNSTDKARNQALNNGSSGARTIPPPIPRRPDRKPVTKPRIPNSMSISIVLDNDQPGRAINDVTYVYGVFDAGIMKRV